MTVSPIDDPALRSQFAAGPIPELFAHESTIQRYLDVEAALARAQASLDLIPAAAAVAITGAARLENVDLSRYAADVERKRFPITPLVDQLAELVPDDFGQWVHWGATSQDIMDTARVLQIRDAFEIIDHRLGSIGASLRTMANDHRTTVMAGRSMLQHAVPVTFGYKAAGWAASVDRLASRLGVLRDTVLVGQLGGAAGTLAAMGNIGTGVRARFCAELDLGDPGITWHTGRDRVADTVHYLALVCACLAKIGFDVALLSQSEIAELREALPAGAGGSSTMPHKHNPVRSQLLLVSARATRQLAGSALEAVVTEHERGTGTWMTEWWSVPEAFAWCGGALEQARDLVAGLDVDADRMRANLDATEGRVMSEAVMMELASKIGRHAAHELVEDIIRGGSEDGGDFTGALHADPRVNELLSDAEIGAALDPAAYLGSIEAMIDFVVDR